MSVLWTIQFTKCHISKIPPVMQNFQNLVVRQVN